MCGIQCTGVSGTFVHTCIVSVHIVLVNMEAHPPSHISIHTHTQLGELVESGPSEEESVCVDCEDFSTGDSCNTCLHGYYNKNVNSSSPLVSCVG